MIPFVISTITDDDKRDFMTRLYINYRALMRKHAITILKSDSDIDDVISDSCIKLIDKIDLLQTLDCCTLPSYIVLTVRRVAIDFIKHRDVRLRHTYLGQEEDALDAISNFDDGFDMAQSFIDSETAKADVRRLKQMRERDRVILEYKYILNMTDKEIAALLGIKPQSVRQYLTRARKNAMEVLRGGAKDGADI